MITRDIESPPLKLGPRRLHYEYSVGLPQLHMTLVSVLQGLAFGVLVSRLPLPPQNASTADFLLEQHYFLPFVASSLLILLIWQQFVFAGLFIVWPVSTLQTGLIYLITLAEILTFEVIAQISAWIVGLGFVAIVGGCIRLNNLRWQKESDYVSVKPAKTWRLSQLTDGVVYIGLGLLYVAWGWNYESVIAALKVHLPSRVESYIDPWVPIFLALLVVVIVGIVDARFRRRFLREVAEGSDLEVTPQGTLGYMNAKSAIGVPENDTLQQRHLRD
jgi:hypothetical protein